MIAGDTVQVAVQASDSATGISSYTWAFGDGAQETTSQPYDRHTYLLPGNYSGRVIVTDGAGNQAAQVFSAVIIPAPTAGLGPSQPTSPTSPTSPSLQISVAEARTYAAAVVARRTGKHPVIRLTCARVDARTLYCRLAWTTSTYRYRASGRFWLLGGNQPHWSYNLRGTQTAITCLRSQHADCTKSFRWHP